MFSVAHAATRADICRKILHMKSVKTFNQSNLLLILGIFITGILLSPKWFVIAAPWLFYSFLLRFFRKNNWKAFVIIIPVFLLSSVIAQYQVVPMPFMKLSILMLVMAGFNILPFIVDKIAYHRTSPLVSMMIFPVIATLFNYLIDQGPQGTWGNFAYTQYKFSSFMQMVSITGIYGVNFIIYWFASTINYYLESRKFNANVILMPSAFVLALSYGQYQLLSESQVKGNLTSAAITIDNNGPIEEMYFVTTGEKLAMPKNMSQADPIVAKFNTSLVKFMSDHQNKKYNSVYSKMDKVLVDYADATKSAAENGAKLVVWSEAAIINTKERDKKYQDQMSKLADDLDLYLFFPTAVFHPEKVGKKDLFIENKVITFGPDGKLLNEYFKNIPVMGVEPSFPGNGKIPVIKTQYGTLSPIICYDADHPELISQISDSGSDILIVPTGDWEAISPYHTYIAAVRCIENGVSMIKATSHGLGAMIDDKGRILSSYDYFDCLICRFNHQKLLMYLLARYLLDC